MKYIDENCSHIFGIWVHIRYKVAVLLHLFVFSGTYIAADIAATGHAPFLLHPDLAEEWVDLFILVRWFARENKSLHMRLGIGVRKHGTQMELT